MTNELNFGDLFKTQIDNKEDNVKNFCHLHVHTIYSLLDGACQLKPLIKRVKDLGMTSLAITDHNHLGGTYAFQKECKMNDIKPLLGVEMYYTHDTSIASLDVDERHRIAYRKYYEHIQDDIDEDEKKKMPDPDTGTIKAIKSYKELYSKYEYDMTQYHILFIAANQTGWVNLIKLQSEASDKCTFNGRFLCDLEMIKKYSEGLICTSACIGNIISKLVVRKKLAEAERLLLEFKEIFGDRFYLEIQPLQLMQQYLTNLFYMDISKKHNIEVVATNDVHYILESDWDDHDSLICISTGAFKSDKTRMRYTNDFWLRSIDEMIHCFEMQNEAIGIEHDAEEYRAFYIQAMNNTNLIADRVDGDIIIGSKKPLLPKVKISSGVSSEDELILKAYGNLNEYYKTHPEIDIDLYRQKLDKEITVINEKGFADYMLVVQEYIEFADKNGIAVGPGRGSAAGSETLYQIGITKNIDPVVHQLMFERFLTPDRTALPDIDVDISYYGRAKVIEHLEDYYGKSKVAHIGTWSALGVLSGIKDFGRVLGVEYQIIDKLSKDLQDIPVAKIEFKFYDALKDENPDMYAKFVALEKSQPEVFRLARKFEGCCRQYGVHASGVLVMPVDIVEYVPTRKSKDDGTTICLYTGVEVDELNLVKLDILGLKTLSVIEDTLKSINNNKERHNLKGEIDFEWLYNHADIHDDKVYETIRNKETDGLFQIESNMFKGMVDIIKPNCINDLTAIGALGRPGPLSNNFHKLYADRKNGNAKIEYPIRDCDDIFKDTYGVIIYQEQLMLISQKIAGFDNGQADSLTRKVFAKKKADQLEMLRRCHYYGKINKQGPEGWEEDSNAPWYDYDKLLNGRPHYGGEIKGAIANGYTVEELDKYWNTIISFASYAFNRSHSACYGYITFLTAWLKTYYPEEFLAALLSMQDKDEKKEKYIEVVERYGIKVSCPDINKSKSKYTPSKKKILYGLSSVRGVKSSVDDIIASVPFISLEDAVTRMPKKKFNKTVASNLIKAGAFDFEDTNRYALLNKLYDLRKDKIERYDESLWDKDACMMFEKEVLGTYVTYKPESVKYKAKWGKLVNGATVSEYMIVNKVKKHVDKNGNNMAFVELSYGGYMLDGIVFSKLYKQSVSILIEGARVLVNGKKEDNKIICNNLTTETVNTPNASISDDLYLDLNEILGLVS